MAGRHVGRAGESVITLVRATQTSMACPSQWDAWDADGNYYYLRYRHGCGQIRHYRTADWIGVDEDQLIEVVAEFEFGHPLDGEISLEEFASHAGIALAPELHETSFGDHLRDELIMDGTFGAETALKWDESEGKGREATQ